MTKRGINALKAAAKDIGAMLPAQRDRIDGLFLEDKSWALPTWRERYLDHPLVGVIARRFEIIRRLHFRFSPARTHDAPADNQHKDGNENNEKSADAGPEDRPLSLNQRFGRLDGCNAGSRAFSALSLFLKKGRLRLHRLVPNSLLDSGCRSLRENPIKSEGLALTMFRLEAARRGFLAS